VRAWQLLLLALSGIRRTPLRVSLTALGVAIATGALLAMVAFAVGLQRSIEEPLQAIELFNRIEVTAEAPRAISDADLRVIREMPGVVAAYPPLMRGGVEIVRGDRRKAALVQGMPPEVAALPTTRALLIAGAPFGKAERDAILLGERLAKDLGFAAPAEAVGAEVTLSAFGLAPAAPGAFAFRTETRPFRVAGVLRSPFGNRIDVPFAAVPWERMRTLPGVEVSRFTSERGGADRPRPPGTWPSVDVRVARPADHSPALERIRKIGLTPETMLDQAKPMRTAFLVLDVVLAAVGTVALVIAALGIVNTLLMAVLERTSEIGTYKALGATTGDVRVLFLFEAGLVGLLGGAGGLLLGRAVSWAIGAGVNRFAQSRGVEEAVSVFAFPWWLVAGALAFALAASLASGAYPASRAARVDPIRALRGL
jgi:putative ABC transport system permease protein